MNEQQEITVILEYFKSLREEIHLRIKEHTHLVWIKLVVLGAIISFLIATFYGQESTSSPIFLTFWIIPVVAIIFDMLIASNLRVINNLGYYIKFYIEGEAFAKFKHPIRPKYLFTISKRLMKKLIKNQLTDKEFRKELKKEFENERFFLWRKYKIRTNKNGWEIEDGGRIFKIKKGGKVYFPEFGFWEEKGAQAASEYRCYTWQDMLAIWSFTLGSLLFSFLLRLQIIGNFKETDSSLAIICSMGIGLALYFLLHSINKERRF